MIYSRTGDGRMAKLENATALGAVGATLGGSNPLPPILLR